MRVLGPTFSNPSFLAASINMDMLVAWGKHVTAFTLLSGQYDFTPRPHRIMLTRNTESRCSLSDCSPLTFLAWFQLVERLSSQCSPPDHCSTQAQPPRQSGSFQSGLSQSAGLYQSDLVIFPNTFGSASRFRHIFSMKRAGEMPVTSSATVNSRSSESAKDCRKRKTLRIQYLAESLIEVCRYLDRGEVPQALLQELNIPFQYDWDGNSDMNLYNA
ncbi:LOW QUALITY PROTEIN: hypothetical protein T265_13420 [Opisthorchis viverrini]|uniref:Uncharacterized protein n=1 Tax=Opisthorchis viverrini TaxID=6198 RepID=A0A074ZQ37_OPIVI|nr:LOW QUALITY PROTEIN: hypothetical protein T265_13420 [Opisthorchis viverrini]KER29181.1 LOW QUALITY PROTEIN: hypothetical protein T265_13420 [Opisthorchis viverrini]